MSEDEHQAWYDQHAWDPARYPGLTVQHDLSPADWIEPLLVPRSFEVWMTAPRGYDAYARIFFPFHRSVQGAGGGWSEESIRWADLASEHGWTVHALMERETISRSSTGDGSEARCSWRLSPEQFAVLSPILAHYTESNSGWFLLWEGFGDLDDKAFDDGVPKVHHEMRDFYLLRGPLTMYSQFSDDPSYWWPDDRSWCLCTDTDFKWSYLAGSRECVDEVLAQPIMDAAETQPENPARTGMDVINDPDGHVPRTP
jgi:hypothetical protein